MASTVAPTAKRGPDIATPETGLLDRERIIAGADFNRWLVPPAALCIHLCIGMAYGFSVFWLPLSKAIGVTDPVACPADTGFLAGIVSTTCDWKISALDGCTPCSSCSWARRPPCSAAGSSARGRARPGSPPRLLVRRPGHLGAGRLSASDLDAVARIGRHRRHRPGPGLHLAGIDAGEWFPDRRGMATGMAIMGFGGGAMIGAPLADRLMKFYATPTSVGVWETFLTMAALYAVFMLAGAFGYRLPPTGWKPSGWTPPTAAETG